MEKSTSQIAESFQCQYQVFEKGSDPQLVEQAYKAAFERGKEEGFYPAIFLLEEQSVEWLTEIVAEDYDRAEIISGCKDNGKEILEEYFQNSMEYMEGIPSEEFLGNETEGETVSSFSGFISFHDGMLAADTLLLEIPVKNPWEIIGYLPMGGWNECPGPEDMISICKYWYEKYGAVPAAFTSDVMEFYAPQGLNGTDPMEAAKEHYSFCSDRVDQGTSSGKLSELAAGLKGSTVWYFWWD
ncbi:MAG: DUF4253 domain-containing protein [Lachnospiraceae bacterium]|nr:DUF4253 domain-containing protein [Lachnospiraceae bacterium]